MRNQTDRQVALQDLNPTPLQFVDIRPAPVRGYAKVRVNWLRFAWRIFKFFAGLTIIVGSVVMALAFIIINW